MSKVLILTGSSRPNSVAQNIIKKVKMIIDENIAMESQVVDVNNLKLPFFNDELMPSTDGFVPKDDNAKSWTAQLASADAVVMITPEYNASLSAIQKNAIDWAYREWINMPVALVGYGWHGGSRAHDNARIVLSNVKANVLANTTNLTFMKEIDVDGSVLDEKAFDGQLEITLNDLLNTIKQKIISYKK